MCRGEIRIRSQTLLRTDSKKKDWKWKEKKIYIDRDKEISVYDVTCVYLFAEHIGHSHVLMATFERVSYCALGVSWSMLGALACVHISIGQVLQNIYILLNSALFTYCHLVRLPWKDGARWGEGIYKIQGTFLSLVLCLLPNACTYTPLYSPIEPALPPFYHYQANTLTTTAPTGPPLPST